MRGQNVQRPWRMWGPEGGRVGTGLCTVQTNGMQTRTQARKACKWQCKHEPCKPHQAVAAHEGGPACSVMRSKVQILISIQCHACRFGMQGHEVTRSSTLGVVCKMACETGAASWIQHWNGPKL